MFSSRSTRSRCVYAWCDCAEVLPILRDYVHRRDRARLVQDRFEEELIDAAIYYVDGVYGLEVLERCADGLIVRYCERA